jgi:hypothetical protein
MKRTLVAVGICLFVLAGGWAVLLAYPTPSTAPASWELRFDGAVPRRIVVNVPNSPNPQAYWYMTFTVTNQSGQERQFLPVFQMLTNEGQLVVSDRNIAPAVFDAIKARHKARFLEPLSKVTGRLLNGEDQARDSVAIWPEPDRKMGHFSIFVAGLSGEMQLYRIENGQYIKVDSAAEMKDLDKDKLVVLRKTLQLKYEAAGESEQLQPAGQEWVMR